MTDKPTSAAEAAKRLLAALDAPDQLSHTEAEALLTDYVLAERQGIDVDALPEYAGLAQHLEHCPECLALYEGLHADLTVMLDADELVPTPQPVNTPLVTTARQTEDMTLRIFGGLQRRFAALFRIPKRAPQFATLSGEERIVLLNEQLTEVAGAPVVSISVGGAAPASNLLVAVVDDRADALWDVRVIVGSAVYEGITDERGMIVFDGLTITPEDEVTVAIAETGSEATDEL